MVLWLDSASEYTRCLASTNDIRDVTNSSSSRSEVAYRTVRLGSNVSSASCTCVSDPSYSRIFATSFALGGSSRKTATEAGDETVCSDTIESPRAWRLLVTYRVCPMVAQSQPEPGRFSGRPSTIAAVPVSLPRTVRRSARRVPSDCVRHPRIGSEEPCGRGTAIRRGTNERGDAHRDDLVGSRPRRDERRPSNQPPR